MMISPSLALPPLPQKFLSFLANSSKSVSLPTNPVIRETCFPALFSCRAEFSNFVFEVGVYWENRLQVHKIQNRYEYYI